jgi:hypothetical protein
MNQTQKIFLLFLIGCIGLRSFIVYLAYNVNKFWLKVMGYVAILPAIGFFYYFFIGTRKIGAFGEKAWWKNLRPVHGSLYLLFAYNAINGNKFAWIYLLLDVIIGLVSFLIFHYKENDFKKLYS